MKKFKFIFGIIMIAVLFAACSDLINITNFVEQDTNMKPGYGLVKINVDDSARTVFPVLECEHIIYSFIRDNEGLPEEMTPQNGIFILEAGEWSVYITAYIGSIDIENLVASGEADFTVVENDSIIVEVPLRGWYFGTGTFIYNIEFPNGAEITEFSLARMPLELGTKIDLSATFQGSGVSVTVEDVPSDIYWLTIQLRIDDNGDIYEAGRAKAVHIYDQLTSEYSAVFSERAFIFKPYYTVSFECYGGTPVPENITVLDGRTITEPDVPMRADYNFLGWYTEATGGDPWNFAYPITRDITLHAQWVLKPLMSIEEVVTYLNGLPAGNTPDTPYYLPVGLYLDDMQYSENDASEWRPLLQEIQNANRYVELDMTSCIMTTNPSNNNYIFRSDLNFIPGKAFIVSMVVPAATTTLYGIGNYYEDQVYFTNLISVTGANVTTLEDYAFRYCKSLAKVSFPKVTNTNQYTFGGCTSLTETGIDLPALTGIRNGAFMNCTGLTEINFPLVTGIGMSSFQGCTNLTKVDLPKVTSISSSAFYGCNSLTEVNLPVVTTIEGSVFSGCTNLIEISLPLVRNIQSAAFNNCDAITSVTVSASLTTTNFSDTNQGTRMTAFRTYYFEEDPNRGAGTYTWNGSAWTGPVSTP